MEFAADDLKIGTKIELIKSYKNHEIAYPSQILDSIESDILIVSGPLKNNNLVFLHKGDSIKVVYNVKEKGIHYFNAKVMSRSYTSIYTIKLKKISEIKKLQLRKYFRLPYSIKVNKDFEIIENDISEILSEECKTINISGGGMELFCNYDHVLGDEVHCSFTIHDSLITVRAVVVRINQIDSLNFKYSLGVSFKDIEEGIRDNIIKYIFEQERILRLKGLV
ncbi:flagellar brake protein [Tissierella sp.]|uniref:flagellar brake protein n=1 Tax=Tissierella sp. TaxID=41274 RepID=UPI0028597814|nr:flagellar brake protein [Tissierella sp.]MDR7856249.1 flagellar brake protein [Tissierella sp.]